MAKGANRFQKALAALRPRRQDTSAPATQRLEMQERKRHDRHRQMAEARLAALLQDGRELSPGLRAQCDDYAREVLGSAIYAPWLHVFAAMQGGFREGWIPDNYYGRVVVPRICGRYGKVSGRKGIAARLFGTDLVPDLCYRVNGRYITAEMEDLPDHMVADYLFAGRDRVVFKREGGGQGKGVRFFRRAEFVEAHQRGLADGAFQREIRQHPTFARFGSGAVATLRVTTVLSPRGIVEPRAAHLRLGTGADTHVMLASQVTVPVESPSGRLEDEGFLPQWQRSDRHPDSGEPFAGKSIPGFEDIRDRLCAFHAMYPFVQVIGWDIAVDEDGAPHILEWNGHHAGILFTEAVKGPCFADLGWQDFWRDLPADPPPET